MRDEVDTYPGLILNRYILKKANASVRKYKFRRPSKPSLLWISIVELISNRIRKQEQVSKIVAINYIVFIVARAHPIGQSISFLIQPFQFPIWLGVITSLVLLTVPVKLARKLGIFRGDFGKNWNRTLDLVLPLLEKPILNIRNLTHERISLRIYIAVWLLCSIIIVSLYKSNIAAYLIEPIYSSPPRTLEKLLDLNYQMVTMRTAISKGAMVKLLSSHLKIPMNYFQTRVHEVNTSKMVVT